MEKEFYNFIVGGVNGLGGFDESWEYQHPENGYLSPVRPDMKIEYHHIIVYEWEWKA